MACYSKDAQDLLHGRQVQEPVTVSVSSNEVFKYADIIKILDPEHCNPTTCAKVRFVSILLTS